MKPLHGNRRHYPRHRQQAQQGFTLLELIVGMVIGLLIIAAALGTLMLSRATSATTSDLAQLQQQASYALRVIGQQVRQGGSYEPVPSGISSDAITLKDFTNLGTLVSKGEKNELTVLTQTPSATSLQRDCLGNAVSDSILTTTFEWDKTNEVLRCSNGTNAAQTIIGNVTDFQVRYRNYSVNAANVYSFGISDTPQVTSIMPTTKGVAAIEICLEVQGAERMPESEYEYINCAGESKEIGERVRRVFRNTYNLRVREAAGT